MHCGHFDARLLMLVIWRRYRIPFLDHACIKSLPPQDVPVLWGKNSLLSLFPVQSSLLLSCALTSTPQCPLGRTSSPSWLLHCTKRILRRRRYLFRPLATAIRLFVARLVSTKIETLLSPACSNLFPPLKSSRRSAEFLIRSRSSFSPLASSSYANVSRSTGPPPCVSWHKSGQRRDSTDDKARQSPTSLNNPYPKAPSRVPAWNNPGPWA